MLTLLEVSSAVGVLRENNMPYTAEISRNNPSCFLFLIDQSGSMSDVFASGDGKRRKSEGVADAINRLLQNLCIKCAKEEVVRDYFQVGLLGYGASVGPAFAGQLTGRELVPITEIANRPGSVEERKRRVEDGTGCLVEQSIRCPTLFDAVAS